MIVETTKPIFFYWQGCYHWMDDLPTDDMPENIIRSYTILQEDLHVDIGNLGNVMFLDFNTKRVYPIDCDDVEKFIKNGTFRVLWKERDY